MKTWIKFLLVIIVVLIAAMLVIPMAFHKQIAEKVKEEANKYINARIDFADYGLSLFRSFPDFSLKISDLTIDGKGGFDGVRLVKIPGFYISIDLLSVFKGGPYKIERIVLDEPSFHLRVLKDGAPNWDIAIESPPEDTPDKYGEKPSSFLLKMNKLTVNDAEFEWIDGYSGTSLQAQGIQFTLGGDFSADATAMKLKALMDGLTLNYQGVNYLYQDQLEVRADIESDLKNSIFTLKNNRVRLNDFLLEFFGSVAMVDDGYDMLLTFKAPKHDFKHILSLIPAVYHKDFEKIKTHGKISVEGSLKGVYTDKQFPAYDIRIEVEDGYFKYPQLNESVENIALKANIKNEGGNADQTQLDIEKFHIEIAQNPLDISLKLHHLLSDPYISGTMQGQIDLASLALVYPLGDDDTIQGSITSDISIDGKISSLEQQDYEDFQALGSLLVKGFKYVNSGSKGGLLIHNAQLNFSPAYIDLVNFSGGINNSDLKAKGTIYNYLGYVLSDDQLSGSFDLTSTYFDLDQFFHEEDQVEPNLVAQDTVAVTSVKVPANIDFSMTAGFKEVKMYDAIFRDVNGKVELTDEKVILHSLVAESFGGQVVLDGSYNSQKTDDPVVDLGIQIKNLSIADAFPAIPWLDYYAPFAQHVMGNFSGKLNFNTHLSENMKPLYSSFNGNGAIQTTTMEIDSINVLDDLSESLNINAFKSWKAKQVDLSFDLEDGKLLVKPFHLNLGEITGTMNGWTNYGQQIEYQLDLKIPTRYFGVDGKVALNSLIERAGFQDSEVKLGDFVTVGAFITGTIINPRIKTSLASLTGKMGETVRSVVTETIEEKKEEVVDQLKGKSQQALLEAREKAQEIINQALAQADQINEQASRVAQQIRDEANKKAGKLVEEGKKKGMLAELAAKKAADKLKSEADEKATRIVEEAKIKADALVAKAQVEADGLIKNAQEKVQ